MLLMAILLMAILVMAILVMAMMLLHTATMLLMAMIIMTMSIMTMMLMAMSLVAMSKTSTDFPRISSCFMAAGRYMSHAAGNRGEPLTATLLRCRAARTAPPGSTPDVRGVIADERVEEAAIKGREGRVEPLDGVDQGLRIDP